MHLFINTIPDQAIYILFDSERGICGQETLELRGHESEQFLASLGGFLAKHSLAFEEIEGIVVVNGPGSFTAMRIVTLTLNTITFVHRVPLYSLDFFQLLTLSWREYPMLIKANRGEYLVKKSLEDLPRIVPIDEVPSGHYVGLGDINDFANKEISIQSELDYNRVIQNLSLDVLRERVEPFYIKKPNIT